MRVDIYFGLIYTHCKFRTTLNNYTTNDTDPTTSRSITTKKFYMNLLAIIKHFAQTFFINRVVINRLIRIFRNKLITDPCDSTLSTYKKIRPVSSTASVGMLEGTSNVLIVAPPASVKESNNITAIPAIILSRILPTPFFIPLNSLYGSGWYPSIIFQNPQEVLVVILQRSMYLYPNRLHGEYFICFGATLVLRYRQPKM